MTTIQQHTLEESLSSGNPAAVATAMSTIQAGKMLSNVKAVFTGLTSATSFDITSAACKAAATVTGLKLDADELLPAIGDILSLRVTAGAAAAGHRNVTDVGGTAAATLATISDDGKTLTFEAGVTAFVLQYRPRAAVALSTRDNFSAP